MKASELGIIKNFLLNQKSSILNKTQEFKESQKDYKDQISDDSDLASHDLSLNMTIHLHERDRSSLLQIERALAKIEYGTYGECESCGDDIEIKRLQARPFTALCIHCMEENESPRTPLN